MVTLRKADLHLHSNISHDVPGVVGLSPRALFEQALAGPDPAHRMDYFTLTDHDTMDGYSRLVRELPEADRRLVIPAVEHTLRDPRIGFTIHVNLYLLDPDIYDRLRREAITIDDLISFCDEYGILMQYNHPTWFEHAEVRAGRIDYNKAWSIADRFAVLELNGGRPRRLNEMTEVLSSALGKILTANSDSHSGDVGSSHNAAPGETAETFMRNIWAGQGSVQTVDMTREGMTRVVHGMIDAVLDDRQCQCLMASMMPGHRRRLEQLALCLFNAPFLRRPGTGREILRALLKQISIHVVGSWMRHELLVARRMKEIVSDHAAHERHGPSPTKTLLAGNGRTRLRDRAA